jgi:lipid-A-disaccharide synthase
MIRIGLVAGEVSGDILGAGLIQELLNQNINVTVEGIGGEKLIKTGMNVLYPMERLSVMGFTEVLSRYKELKSIRDDLIKYFIKNPPDVFIGIDAPDFNLFLEKSLKEAGIKTIHYVSPSVYAWREYRVKKIKKSVDLILNLFPFENKIYDKYKIKSQYVGHPLADKIDNNVDIKQIKTALALPEEKTIVALLPGSRLSEIKKIAEPLLQAAKLSNESNSELVFVSSLTNKKTFQCFEEIKKDVAPELDVKLFVDKTHDVMASADVILLASGTATLEAMLFNKPMIVAYKLSWLTHMIVKLLAKIPYASLPNILAGKRIVPEYLQYQCTAENLSNELISLLNSREKTEKMKNELSAVTKGLRQGADKNAADAVLKLLKGKAYA